MLVQRSMLRQWYVWTLVFGSWLWIFIFTNSWLKGGLAAIILGGALTGYHITMCVPEAPFGKPMAPGDRWRMKLRSPLRALGLMIVGGGFFYLLRK